MACPFTELRQGESSGGTGDTTRHHVYVVIAVPLEKRPAEWIGVCRAIPRA